MAPKKNKKVKGGGTRANDVRPDDPVSPSAPSDTVTPSINIAAYPHILSSILDHSSSTILTTFLRCSKVMLMTVAPRIYRNLRITSRQLAGLLDIGWAPSKRGSTLGLPWESFSPFAKECLQGVQTLHLLHYDSTVEYEKVPRGLFADIRKIVLYPLDAMYLEDYLALSFPTTFTSLVAPDIYVRFSESAVRLKSRSRHIIQLESLPRTVTTLTFLIPLVCLLPYPPRCDFWGGHCDTTFVLLPWPIEEEEPDFKSSLLNRWSASHQPLAAGDRLQARIFGAEHCGTSDAMQHILGLLPRLPNSLLNSFIGWIYRTQKSRPVFNYSEFRALLSANGRISDRMNADGLAKLEASIEQLRAGGADPASPMLIQMEDLLVQHTGLAAEGRYVRAREEALEGGAKSDDFKSMEDFLASGSIV